MLSDCWHSQTIFLLRYLKSYQNAQLKVLTKSLRIFLLGHLNFVLVSSEKMVFVEVDFEVSVDAVVDDALIVVYLGVFNDELVELLLFADSEVVLILLQNHHHHEILEV